MKLWFHCYEDESGGDNGGNKDGLIAFLLRQEGEISESRVGKGLAKATWAKKSVEQSGLKMSYMRKWWKNN